MATRLRAHLDQLVRAGLGSGWLRHKGNLTHSEVSWLIAVGVAPLILMLIRISAFQGVGPPLSETWLPSLGRVLNQFFSLQEIPATDRGQVLYLLFIPTGVLLISLARLTFGLRVIGFRSILIAVGFQHCGVVPGLVLLAIMVAMVIAVRPVLVRFRLPLYARVSVIMCLSVSVLLFALLAAPLLRSDALFGIGFFPALILGLMAEKVAKTMDRDSWLAASWRSGMTIAIALLLAGIGQFTMLREFQIQFPELVITQIVAVILISEFLDLRLFEDLDARLSGIAAPKLFSDRRGIRVVLVRNQRRNGVIGRLGEPMLRQGYDRHAIRRIAAALRERGHTVRIFEGDMRLLSKLRDFIPPHPRTGGPGGLVLNLSEGIQGELPAAHVPAMLEMAGVVYTGATPQGHLVTSDRLLTAAMLRNVGLEALEPQSVRTASELRGEPSFPSVVEPRFGPRGESRVVRDRRQLAKAIRRVVRRPSQEAVVRRRAYGREIQVAVLGNDSPECLPLVEARSAGRGLQCPAVLDEALAERIRSLALAASRACGCRDYALVRVRVSSSGRLRVVGVGEAGSLAPGSAFMQAAEAAGIPFDALIERIIEAARDRYRPSAPPDLEVVPGRADAAQFVAGTALGS